MSNKQTSLFDFDEPPAKNVEEEITLQKETVENIFEVISEEPVEISFIKPAENIKVKEEAPTQKRGRRKLTETYITADLIDVPEDEILFQKKYYGIFIVA